MRYCLAAVAALAIQASAANADIVALTGDGSLATIDKSGKVTGTSKISGIGPVLGIDVRPADGQLYALSSDGTIATVDRFLAAVAAQPAPVSTDAVDVAFALEVLRAIADDHPDRLPAGIHARATEAVERLESVPFARGGAA